MRKILGTGTETGTGVEIKFRNGINTIIHAEN